MTRTRTPLHWPHLALLSLWPAAIWMASALRAPSTLALAAWLVVNLALLGLGEYLQPFRADWSSSPRQLRRDGSVFALNLIVDAALSAALTAIAIAVVPGTSHLPLFAQIVLGLLVAELGSYWLHRWSHREGWLWRVHVLHHRPEALNLSNSVFAHPINVAYDKAAKLLPLLILGVQPDALLAIALFGLTQSLVAHANVAGGIGWLDRVVGGSSLHRLHHSTNESQAGNFGTALPIWDQAFGTYRRGDAPASVGVFDRFAYPTEFELARLLCWPLRSVCNFVAPALRCC